MVAEPPPPVPWIVEGLAVFGSLTLLTGREGEGKSLLALSTAVGVALGERVAGFDCEQGRALVIDAENGAHEIHRRVHALGVPPSGIVLAEADGFHLGRDLVELHRLIVEVQPTLLILDSFRSLWPGGDENDSGAVAAVLDPLRNLVRYEGVATLLLHHLPKSGSFYRGTTAIGAAVELGFRLGRVPDDPERASRRLLECFKSRPAPEPDQQWLRLHVERGQVFVDGAEPFEKEAQATVRPVRDELAPRLVAAADEPVSWPTLARSVGRDPKDRTARRLRDELLKEGVLRRLEDERLVTVACDEDPKGDATLPPKGTDERP